MNIFILVNLAITLINVIVLGLAIKVYTEITKDKLQDKRKETP